MSRSLPHREVAADPPRGHIIALDDIPRDFIEHVFNRSEPITGGGVMQSIPSLKWKKIKRFLIVLYDAGVLRVEEEETREHDGQS